MYKVVDSLNSFRRGFEDELNNPYNSTLGVRILLFDSFQALRYIENELSCLGEKIVYLEDYIPQGKNWMSLNDLKNVIGNLIKGKGVSYIFSLDNLLRFYSTNELKVFLSNILRTRTYDGYAVLLLAGLKERIKELREAYKNQIYEIQSAGDKVKMFVFNPEIKIKQKCIENLKEFLGCWKKEGVNFYIKHRVVYENRKKAFPDTAVDVIEINNCVDILKKIVDFKDDIHFTDSEFEKEFVNELLGNESRINSFRDMFPSINNLTEFAEAFLKEKRQFKCNLLLNFAYNHLPNYRNLLDENKLRFLIKVYRELEDKEEKQKILSLAIKLNPVFENLICEELGAVKKENIIGILKCEKKELLNLLKREKISFEELKSYSDDFLAYLYTPKPPNLKNNQGWVLEYIDLYKKSKLKDKPLRGLESLLKEKSLNFYDWYYDFDWILDLADNWKNRVERAVWIDALGFEWAGFILRYLERKGIPVHAFYICRANIPSITEINKPNFDVSEAREFDELIHKRYEFPDMIIRQIELLKEILDKEISAERKTLLFSDHGSSALIRLYEPIKLLTDVKFEHGGRYFKGYIEHDFKNKEVIRHKENGEVFYIAATHKPVNAKPQGEAHGGATPEEVLTFAIIAGGHKRVSYNVDIPNKKISRREKKLLVRIKPVPEASVEFTIDGRSVEYQKESDTDYTVNLTNIRSGKHIIEVKIGSNIYKEEFRIIGGIEEEFSI